jgi:hypothetical protein
MRWVLAVGNIAAAVALIFLGNLAATAHRTHAYSTYRELVDRGVLRERPGFDVEKRLETIAAGGAYSQWVAWFGTGACTVNAGIFTVLALNSRRPAHPPPAPKPHD